MFCDSNGNFQNDFSFDDLLNIYIFDRRLRALFIEALERIELAVRNSIVDIVSVNTGNEYFIYDSSNFNSGYNGVFTKIRDNVWYQTDKKVDINNNRICCWDIVKHLTFGCLSTFYDELKGNIRQDIADIFNLKNKVMSSWLLSMSASRNICAHYSLLWSRIFSIKPMNLKRDNNLIVNFDTSADKLYAQFYIISYFMLQISPTTSWVKGLDVPETPEIKTECHLLSYDQDGRITYTPVEMENETEKQEEQNEIAPLSFNENAMDIVEDDEWAGFPPETNLEELKPEPMTPEDEAVFEPISQQQEITPNFKADKKSKKKSGKKKSKK